jgi:hypothetical protein
MGRMDKAEIQQELEHLNKLLAIAHANRRALEEQQIQQGIIAPLSLINQMNEVKQSIQEYEERKNQLKIQSVEEDVSLAEAEYRVMAAEALERGFLTTLGMAQLELTRLRVQMTLEKAQQIQDEVRSSLVRDIFRTLEPEDFLILEGSSLRGVKRIYTAIRLDKKEFLRLLAQTKNYSEDLLESIVKHMPSLIDNPLFQEETGITKQEMPEEILRSKSEKLLTTWKKFIRPDP